ncbi:hypothetical protein SMCF_3013, partial [Streptomyces coelicoflavus ZG0656]
MRRAKRVYSLPDFVECWRLVTK